MPNEHLEKGYSNQEEALNEIPSSQEYIEQLREKGSDRHIQAYQKVIEIAEEVRKRGGKVLLVGGSVRDMLLGKISKDFDIEVYGIEPDKIEEIARQYGEISDVGKAFGILKMPFGRGVDIDISLPRTDSKIGVGHKGFEVKTDPHMSIRDASKRRDFTINSMALDPLSGELHDPFEGKKDLANHVLRATDEERFKDDPLRALRAMQFIARFNLEADPETKKAIAAVIPELKDLPGERLSKEWAKLLLKSEKPSLGLKAGMELGIFQKLHPEFASLPQTPQNPEWHPEGDVWIHTLICVDKAAEIIRREGLEIDPENIQSYEALTIMLSALCHDLGKPSTTKLQNGKYISHGHEQAGTEPTKKFLAQIRLDFGTRDKIVHLVKNHLYPSLLYKGEIVRGEKISDKAIRKLAERLHPATITELILLAEADQTGRGEGHTTKSDFPAGAWLLERAKALGVDQSLPTHLVKGQDFIDLGYQSGREIGTLISLANDLRDDRDFTQERVLEALCETTNVQEGITKLEQLLAEK